MEEQVGALHTEAIRHLHMCESVWRRVVGVGGCGVGAWPMGRAMHGIWNDEFRCEIVNCVHW